MAKCSVHTLIHLETLMAFTNSDDVNILQASDGSVVGAGAGSDRYVLSAATLSNGQRITISDTAGLNALQLVGGLVVTSSQVTNSALLLNLNNGAQITLLGANTFNYITGGDPISGTGGSTQNFNDFVTQSLRTTVPPGNTPNNGGTVTVNNNGGTTAGGGNPAQTVAIVAAAPSVNEGATAVFNVNTQNVPNGTVYTFQITGVTAPDVTGGALTGTVTINNNIGTIAIGLASDNLTEGAESLVVTLGNTGLANAPTASVTVNDTSLTPAPVATVSVVAAAPSVNEGSSIVFNVNTQNVANGTVYTFQITGVAPSDVVGGNLSGTVTINNGVGTITVPLAADNLTEGAESLTLTLIGTGQANAPAATVTVNDTSLTPVATYALTSGIDTIGSGQTTGNSSGTADLNTLNNGDRIVDDSTTDNDTLIVQITGATPLNSTVNFTNIENVGFNVLSGVLTVDALNYAGLKVLGLGGQGGLTVTNMQLPSTVLRLIGTNGNLNVGYNAASVTGVADTVTVDLVGTTAGTVTLGAGVEALRLTTTSGQANTLNALTGTFTTLQVTGGGDVTIGSPTNLTAIAAGVTTVQATDTAKANLFLTGGANTSVFTGNGADTVRFNTALLTTNLVSAGNGSDTLILGAAANAAAVISGVETIQLTQADSSLNMLNATGGVALDFQGGGTLTVSNATAGTSVKTSTAGTTGNISFTYADTLTNQSLNLDLARPVMAASTISVQNAANVTVSTGSTGPQTFGALTLDNTANGTDTSRTLTLNANAAGSALATGAIMAANTLTDLTLRASGLGSSVTIGNIAADSLQSFTIAAANGGASIGDISGSTALSAIDIEVGAGNLALTGNADITANNAAGINTVALRASGGNIGAMGPGNAFIINNTNGGINTVTLGGTGNIFTELTSGVGRVQSVNSTATGDVQLTIINSAGLDMPGSTVVLGNAANGKQNTLTLNSDRADTVSGGTGVDVIATGAGNDVVSAGGGDDTITGGAGADVLTGGTGNDTFVFVNTAETRNAQFTLNDTTNANLDRVTDFNGNGPAAGDVFQLDVVGTMAVVNSLVNFTNAATVVISARSVGTLTAINNFTELTTALNSVALNASTTTSARVLDITVSSGNLAGRYLLVNDGVANVDLANDLIINITGVTGAINAADFSFV